MNAYFLFRVQMPNVRLLLLLWLFSLCWIPAYSATTPSQHIVPKVQWQATKKQVRKLHRQEKREARKQRKVAKLWSKLQDTCHCSPKGKQDAPDPALDSKYSRTTRLVVTGIFLGILGIASLMMLFTIAPTTGLAVWKVLAGITLVVGERMVCSYGQVCIFNSLFDIFYIFW